MRKIFVFVAACALLALLSACGGGTDAGAGGGEADGSQEPSGAEEPAGGPAAGGGDGPREFGGPGGRMTFGRLTEVTDTELTMELAETYMPEGRGEPGQGGPGEGVSGEGAPGAGGPPGERPAFDETAEGGRPWPEDASGAAFSRPERQPEGQEGEPSGPPRGAPPAGGQPGGAPGGMNFLENMEFTGEERSYPFAPGVTVMSQAGGEEGGGLGVADLVAGDVVGLQLADDGTVESVAVLQKSSGSE